jgi:hypothetical protein
VWARRVNQMVATDERPGDWRAGPRASAKQGKSCAIGGLHVGMAVAQRRSQTGPLTDQVPP